MKRIKYFFRGIPEDYSFSIGSGIHWIIISVILIGIEFIIKNRKKLRTYKWSKAFEETMVIILCLQQSLLYLWYLLSGNFSIQESLPLYNCRIGIIFTIFAFLTEKDLYKNICCYWGIIGAILALTFPVTDPFYFPHYTLFSFFIGHIFMLWSAFYFLIVEKHFIDKKSLISILKFTNIYHILIYIFNDRTGSNYCYLNAPPFSIEIVDQMSQLVYTFTAFIIFNITMMIFYYVYKIFYMHYLKKKAMKKHIINHKIGE